MERTIKFIAAYLFVFLLQLSVSYAWAEGYNHFWAVDPETELRLGLEDGEGSFKAVDTLLSAKSPLVGQTGGGIYSLRSADPASCRIRLTSVSKENVAAEEFVGFLSVRSFLGALANWSEKEGERVDRVTLVLSNLGDCERSYCQLANDLRTLNSGFTLDLVSVNDPIAEENAKALECLAEKTGGLIAEVSTSDELDRALGNVLRASLSSKTLIELEERNALLSKQVSELKIVSDKEKGRLGEASVLLGGLQERLDESLSALTEQKIAVYEANNKLADAENQVRYDRQLRSIVEASYEKLQATNASLRQKLKSSEENEITVSKELNDLMSEVKKNERRKSKSGETVNELLVEKTELETTLLSARSDAVAEAEKRIATEQKLEEVLIALETKHRDFNKLRRELSLAVDNHNDTLKKLTDANVDLTRILGTGGISNFSSVKQEIITLREALDEAKDAKEATELQYAQLQSEFELEKAKSLELISEIHVLKSKDLGGVRELALASQKIAEIGQDLLDEKQARAEAENSVRLVRLEVSNLKSEIDDINLKNGKNVEEQAALNAEVDALNDKITQKEERIDVLKSELWAWREEAKDKITAAAEERVADARRLQQQAEIHRQDALRDKDAAFKATKQAEKREQKVSQELQILALKYKSLETQHERREKNWKDANAKIAEIENELAELSQLRESERTSLLSLSSQVGDFEHQIAALENEKQQLLSEVRAREEILDDLQHHFADLQDKHITSLTELDKAKNRYEEAEARLQDLMPIN